MSELPVSEPREPLDWGRMVASVAIAITTMFGLFVTESPVCLFFLLIIYFLNKKD